MSGTSSDPTHCLPAFGRPQAQPQLGRGVSGCLVGCITVLTVLLAVNSGLCAREETVMNMAAGDVVTRLWKVFRAMCAPALTARRQSRIANQPRPNNAKGLTRLSEFCASEPYTKLRLHKKNAPRTQAR